VPGPLRRGEAVVRARPGGGVVWRGHSSIRPCGRLHRVEEPPISACSRPALRPCSASPRFPGSILTARTALATLGAALHRRRRTAISRRSSSSAISRSRRNGDIGSCFSSVSSETSARRRTPRGGRRRSRPGRGSELMAYRLYNRIVQHRCTPISLGFAATGPLLVVEPFVSLTLACEILGACAKTSALCLAQLLVRPQLLLPPRAGGVFG